MAIDPDAIRAFVTRTRDMLGLIDPPAKDAVERADHAEDALSRALDIIEALLAERGELIEATKAHFRDGKRLGALEAEERALAASSEARASEAEKKAELETVARCRSILAERDRHAPAIRAAVRLASRWIRQRSKPHQTAIVMSMEELLEADCETPNALGRVILALDERLAEQGY